MTDKFIAFLIEQAGMPEDEARDPKKVENWIMGRMLALFEEKQLLLDRIFHYRREQQENFA